MPSHSYVPDAAGWAFLCRSDLVLGLNVVVGDERIGPMWELIESGARSPELLDEVTRGGISSTPSFVLAELLTESSVRILSRGDAQVRVSDLSGETVVSGAGVSSWAEQVVALPAAITCEVGAPVSRDAGLPVVNGVVRARSLDTDFGGTSASVASVHTVAPVAAVTPALSPAPAPTVVPSRVAAQVHVSSETIAAMPEDAEPLAAVDGAAEIIVPAGLESPDASSGYDHLFGETMFRSVEEAAVRSDVEESTSIEEHTVVAGNLAELRAQRRAARKAAPETSAPSTSLYVDLSTGGRELLDQTLIVGRAPSATRVSDGKVPRLVSMTTPNQDISRTHVQLAVEGGTVVVTDLHSKNGTLVRMPGKPPLQLRAGEPSVVIVGSTIDLGDGAVLTVGEQQ